MRATPSGSGCGKEAQTVMLSGDRVHHTYQVKHDMRILYEVFNLVEILVSSYDGLDTKLRLQCLCLASIPD